MDLEVVLSPEGKVQGCRMLEAWGSKTMGPLGCAVMVGTPWSGARDGENRPVFGITRFPLVLQAASGSAIVPRGWTISPDVELEVSALPKSKEPLAMTAGVLVSADGEAIGCDPQWPDKEERKFGERVAAYGKLACEAAMTLKNQKMAGPDGAPITYVRAARIRFLPAAAAK